MIRTKRIYDAASPDDGYRVLVDRLWPRGVKKEAARIDAWLKEIAPSHELRKWFGSEGASYAEFVRRYHKELEAPELAPLLADLKERAKKGPVTLLYAKTNTRENNAEALKDILLR
ncbi:MAG: DUF488 domain-containing protein [Hyphomicrobiaceae bacterium]|nr:MAG: DUF488 domain-containing protein [Hyphomicrobiaceae bacterium]